jgi:hypothetical protein
MGRKKENIELILNGQIKEPYSITLKRHMLPHLGDKCSSCNLNMWQGKIITLELDHIDGDRWNNNINNVRLLCPNCHSLTPTWKKKKIKKEKISEEKLLEIIKTNPYQSINFILSNIIKDHNTEFYYKKIKNLCSVHNLPVPKRITKPFYSYGKFNTKKEYYLSLLKNSKIDFNKKTWGIEVSKLLKITPQYALNLVKNHFSHLLK